MRIVENNPNEDLIRVINYKYDAQGNRIAKTVLNDDPSVSVDEETYFNDDGRLVQQRTRTTTQPEEADLYIRDAQGNPLALPYSSALSMPIPGVAKTWPSAVGIFISRMPPPFDDTAPDDMGERGF